MPLIVPRVTARYYQSNLGAADRYGTAITASATPHTKGAYTELIASTARPSYGVWIRLRAVATAATVTSQLTDIAIGGAGSELVLIPNLNGWGAPPHGKDLFFPIYIPLGSRVSARSQAAIASDTITVAVWFCHDAPYPWAVSRITDYGAVLASSRGTPVTPGTNAWGAYAQIVASTDRAHAYWAVGMDGLEDTTLASDNYVIEIALGAAGAEKTMNDTFLVRTMNTEEVYGASPPFIYRPVPSGTRLAARMSGPDTEARGLIIYGMD